MKHFYYLFFILLVSANNTSLAQTSAIYDIVFTSTWNATDHGTLPGGAHWSQLVGANHNSNITFLEMGQLATQGIENVAELGNNTIFNNEVQTSITNGNTEQYINGSGLGTATGTITISNLQVSEDFPLLTLVSMIAPSPDWMIAINSLNLRDNGNWKSTISVDLFPYDAGTDSGMNYTSADADTNPKENISSLVNIAPFGSEKIGTLTITLQSVLGLNDTDLNKSISIFPNPVSQNYLMVDQGNLAGQTKYTITNIIGQKLIEGDLDNNKIEVNQLASGTYFLQLKTEGSRITKKFIKN